MEEWSYKTYQIKEGLKPESKQFQYFFVVSEGGDKKCNYCVWIEDEALSRFDPSKKFEAIVSARREDWGSWVKTKIDREDFRNSVLKYDRGGEKEVDLSEMKEHLTNLGDVVELVE